MITGANGFRRESINLIPFFTGANDNWRCPLPYVKASKGVMRGVSRGLTGTTYNDDEHDLKIISNRRGF